MKRILYAAIVVIGVALDQIVKFWARTVLMGSPGQDIPVWQGVFHLRYLENRGAAFGILEGHQWFFLILTGIVSVIIFYIVFIRKNGLPPMPGIPAAFLLAGAIGNWIDRAFLGYVVDLFDFRLINFAVFNIADSFVVCSVIIIAGWALFSEYYNDRKKAARKAEEESAKIENVPDEEHSET